MKYKSYLSSPLPCLLFRVMAISVVSAVLFHWPNATIAVPPPRFDLRSKPVIHLQPFKGMPTEQTQYVHKMIKNLYAETVLDPPIALPAQAFYKPRQRYRADSIIEWLTRNAPEHSVVIGLTSKDISTTKGKVADWGVMGLGFEPGNACVVSTFRLSKRNLLDQLFKVSVHELGHTQGLPHCPDKTCFMADAEGGNPTDGETGFCDKCKARLRVKGWQLK